MQVFEKVCENLRQTPSRWLVTGAAGFIGSNLTEYLLDLGQEVVGLDNYSTGKRETINNLSNKYPEKFKFIEGDIRDLDTCIEATTNIDYCLHQAALGAVPRSIKDPLASHQSNVNGQLNILIASRDNDLKKIVYASSSSVYGDNKDLPKLEENIGNQLSPYAITKYVNELYASIFFRTYGLKSIGVRYFNVFGKRQDPESTYAAVIPKWVKALIQNEGVAIFGDGETSRDFCYIKNVIQMNILAATTENEEAFGKVFNCACGERTTLTQLFSYIKENLSKTYSNISKVEASYEDFRAGDIRHSLADISKAQELLGYSPTHLLKEGLNECLDWYRENLK